MTPAAIQHALQRRAALRGPETNALRIIDGAGDGFPGCVVEDFAGRLLLSTTVPQVPQALLRWLADTGAPVYHKALDQHQKDAPRHHGGSAIDEPFVVMENGARFEISFQSGYSQGIFLDQRDNRAEVRRLCRPGLRVLNTFAYTGAFSVAAALGGAETTTLDLSRPYLDWAKRNFQLNGLDPQQHHACKGDTFHWLRRFQRQGRRFDGIILDPPTFSRDEDGKVFRAGEDFGKLASLAAEILAPDGWMLCCTNFRGITPRQFETQVVAAVRKPGRAVHAAMPADFTDIPYLKSLWLRR